MIKTTPKPAVLMAMVDKPVDLAAGGDMYIAFIELYLRLSDAYSDEEWKTDAKGLKKTAKAAS